MHRFLLTYLWEHQSYLCEAVSQAAKMQLKTTCFIKQVSKAQSDLVVFWFFLCWYIEIKKYTLKGTSKMKGNVHSMKWFNWNTAEFKRRQKGGEFGKDQRKTENCRELLPRLEGKVHMYWNKRKNAYSNLAQKAIHCPQVVEP